MICLNATFSREAAFHPELRPSFLNNFCGHLPDGFYRRFDSVCQHSPCSDPRASKKRRRQTLAQFHAAIDKSIAELGLSSRRIRALIARDEPEKLTEYTWPLYLRLRAAGYRHYPDLTA